MALFILVLWPQAIYTPSVHREYMESAMSRAYLVESIPTGLEDLRTADGHYTEAVLHRLVEQTRHSIDLTAMYWTLRTDNPRPDEMGLTEERLLELGADHGRSLFDALLSAAARGVHIRILQSPGFGDAAESEVLREQFPEQVEIRQINMVDWYESGIMHHKLWIFDQTAFYLGSANMDWRALTQVKEIGIGVEAAPELTADVVRFYDTWWAFCALEPSTRRVFDPAVRIERVVPAWSALVPVADRAPNPLDQPHLRTSYNLTHPLPVTLNDAPATVVITSSPPEICPPGRTTDLDAMLHTIHEAEESLCLSFMNFVPLGFYGGTYDHSDDKMKIDGQLAMPLWWPDFNDALIQAAVTRGVQVRLLMSRWAHTSPYTEPYLRALRDTARAALANPHMGSGTLDIKWFLTPGWDRVAGTNRQYPEFSRVNHTKYIVSDKRVNIGTSNISWGYFATTSGTSFNSDHADLVRQLQAVFDRDWESRYAYPLV